MHLMKLKNADSEIADAITGRDGETEFASGADRIGELGKQSSHGSNGKSAYK